MDTFEYLRTVFTSSRWIRHGTRQWRWLTARLSTMSGQRTGELSPRSFLCVRACIRSRSATTIAAVTPHFDSGGASRARDCDRLVAVSLCTDWDVVNGLERSALVSAFNRG